MRLETPRLVIRLAVADDAPALQRLFSDPEVLRFLPPTTPWTLERAQQAIERRTASERERGFTAWIVERRDTQEVIGSCALQLVEGTGPEVEIAYHYFPSTWGKGSGARPQRRSSGTAWGRSGWTG